MKLSFYYPTQYPLIASKIILPYCSHFASPTPFTSRKSSSVVGFRRAISLNATSPKTTYAGIPFCPAICDLNARNASNNPLSTPFQESLAVLEAFGALVSFRIGCLPQKNELVYSKGVDRIPHPFKIAIPQCFFWI